MRTIGVVTTSRADYGIYRPLLQRLRADADVRLQLFVSGMHLSPEFGLTLRHIEADGYPIAERVEMLLSSDSPAGIAKSMGVGVIGFAQAYARTRPDILVVLGDRFEMHAAVAAAAPFKIPIAHLHGGELTLGALDDALRHSITKFSHLHFVATETYARRVRQMGEEDWRVVVSGALSLDSLHTLRFLDRAELEATFNLRLAEAPLLVTFHPTTLEYEQTSSHMRELLAALEMSGWPVVFTLPNADTHGRVLMTMIDEALRSHPTFQQVKSFGTEGYFSMMKMARAMVGNSSSGIIEAASLELPVVNIGNRQRGRVRGANVIDVGYDRAAILSGIQHAVTTEFRAGLRGMANPYAPRGAAAAIIAETLKSVRLGEALVVKQFCDRGET